MLRFDPNKRVDCTQALQSQYFYSDPKPTHPENLPVLRDWDSDPAPAEQGLLNVGVKRPFGRLTPLDPSLSKKLLF